MIHIGYVNADYTIQFFHEIGNGGVTIGVRSGIKDDPAPFVVWNYDYENGVPSFYWGAYSDEKVQAITTFIEKARALVSKLDWPAWCALRTQEESKCIKEAHNDSVS